MTSEVWAPKPSKCNAVVIYCVNRPNSSAVLVRVRAVTLSLAYRYLRCSESIQTGAFLNAMLTAREPHKSIPQIDYGISSPDLLFSFSGNLELAQFAAGRAPRLWDDAEKCSFNFGPDQPNAATRLHC